MKHWDVYLGFGGAALTYIIEHYNSFVAAVAGTITLGIVILRFRREWRHKDD